MTDSAQTVEERCRQLLYEGATDSSARALGLARRQTEVRGLGWRHVPAEALPGPPGSVLLEDVLAEAIMRFNPALQSTPDRARAVIGELRSIAAASRTEGIAEARARIVPWILGQRALPGRLYVRLVDLGDVEENSFIVAEHRQVETAGGGGEAAFVFYVNGIPLVVLDTETPGAGDHMTDPSPADSAAAAAGPPAFPGPRLPGEEVAVTAQPAPEAPADDMSVAPASAANAAPAEAAPADGSAPGGEATADDAPDPAAPADTAAAGGEPAADTAPAASEPPAAAGESPDAAGPAPDAPVDAGAAEAPAAPPAPAAPRRGTWQMAASRVIRLTEEVPELFAANLITAATDGREFRLAAAGVGIEEWQAWDPGSGADDPVASAIRTVLRPDSLLDQLTAFAFGDED